MEAWHPFLPSCMNHRGRSSLSPPRPSIRPEGEAARPSLLPEVAGGAVEDIDADLDGGEDMGAVAGKASPSAPATRSWSLSRSSPRGAAGELSHGGRLLDSRTGPHPLPVRARRNSSISSSSSSISHSCRSAPDLASVSYSANSALCLAEGLHQATIIFSIVGFRLILISAAQWTKRKGKK